MKVLMLLLWAGSGVAQPAPAPPDRAQLQSQLVDGVTAALNGQKKSAIRKLERAALLGPEVPGVQGALGCAALLLNDRARATRVLARLSHLSTYYAMSQFGGRGGASRARTTLAKELKVRDKSAEPGALFLAALAFHEADQKTRADKVLKRALSLSKSVLDDAFAPDPAVCLTREAMTALRAIEKEEGAKKLANQTAIDFAGLLIATARRGEAVRMAESLLKDPAARGAALRVLVLVENAAEARRALERIERILRTDKDAEDVRVARVILLLRSGQAQRAQKALAALPVVDEPELQAELHRARAEIALTLTKDYRLALESAEAAIRADHKSDDAVAVYVRALVANEKYARAEAFADALIKRKPRGVNPFRLYAEIHAAAGDKSRADGNRLRADAFDMEQKNIEAAVEAREEVLRAVRDAESGLGVTGLEATRGEHPALSLPVDLAIARSGPAGSAISARERILVMCGPRLSAFLGGREGWDHVTVRASLYGQVETLEAPLSAANPGRCSPKAPSRKRLRR